MILNRDAMNWYDNDYYSLISTPIKPSYRSAKYLLNLVSVQQTKKGCETLIYISMRFILNGGSIFRAQNFFFVSNLWFFLALKGQCCRCWSCVKQKSFSIKLWEIEILFWRHGGVICKWRHACEVTRELQIWTSLPWHGHVVLVLCRSFILPFPKNIAHFKSGQKWPKYNQGGV